MNKYDVITVPSGQNIETERMRSKLKIMELEQKLKELQEAVMVMIDSGEGVKYHYEVDGSTVDAVLEVLKKQGVSDEGALLVG